MQNVLKKKVSNCLFSARLISHVNVGNTFNATAFDSTGYAECWKQANNTSGAGTGSGPGPGPGVGGGGTNTLNCITTRLG